MYLSLSSGVPLCHRGECSAARLRTPCDVTESTAHRYRVLAQKHGLSIVLNRGPCPLEWGPLNPEENASREGRRLEVEVG